jgi:hypothetical protein
MPDIKLKPLYFQATGPERIAIECLASCARVPGFAAIKIKGAFQYKDYCK